METACVCKLPDLPSALIRVALEDLEKCEKDPRYEISMGDFHFAYQNKCYVCLAGAVIAQTLGAGHQRDCGPTALVRMGMEREARAMYALDSFRVGRVEEALGYLQIPKPADMPATRAHWHYSSDPAQFKTDMRALADLLESKGL
jgi:hypothetical protein